MSSSSPDSLSAVGQSYSGKELELARHARNWKRYWASHVRSYLRGDVLEVGAGIGSNPQYLFNPQVTSWTCIEPDPVQAQLVKAACSFCSTCRIIVGTLETVPSKQRFDSIIYIDVLEHIEDDRAEAQRAAAHLHPGGRLVVLGPAHQSLYSPFDASIGHFRRYNKASLAKLEPTGCRLESLYYLDTAGLLASSMNRLILKQSMLNHHQIQAWDRLLIPVSRWLDPLLGYRAGKSILAVWTKA